ncbi:MAG TPA: L,D-transpeptidase family protein, partial [Ilumatobacteraceae bacterium]|nr:L,D-transpeptidase family protein [Ilumatobacteraceae bacterium]
MNRTRQQASEARPWLPAVAAGLVLALVVGVGIFAGDGAGNVDAREPNSVGESPESTNSEVMQPAGLAAPTSTMAAPAAPVVAPLAAPLAMGSAGDDVRRVQERLGALGFQPGPADGQYGSGTQQAVWAYKKLVGNVTWEEFAQLDDQSVVTDELWQQMSQSSVRFLPRRPGTGTHVEIYLPLQVMAVFTDDQPIFISHISSGELRPDGQPATFCETATYDTDENGNPYPEPVTKQVCAESKSPGGVFSFRRYYDGNRVSPLGGMKNPWYFNYGIAIHGARNVPTSPASHGCIRLSNSLADVFPDLVDRGDRVYVWGHDGKEPEQYTERESYPSFNRPDPNATTTTTSTT